MRKFDLNLQKNNLFFYLFLQIIPSDRRAIADKDSETWTLSTDSNNPNPTFEAKDNMKVVSEDHKTESSCTSEEQRLTCRNHETRKSKSKRVKRYLKRCKGALTKAEDNSNSCEGKKPDHQTAAWYVQDDDKKEEISQEKKSEDIMVLEVESEIETNSIIEQELDCDFKADEMFELCKLRTASKDSLYDEKEEKEEAEVNVVTVSNCESYGQEILKTKLEDKEVIEIERAVVVEEESVELAERELNECSGSSDTLIAEQHEESEKDFATATPTIIPNAVVSTAYFTVYDS